MLVYLKPTEACNFNCKHCFNANLKFEKSLMPVEQAIEIVRGFERAAHGSLRVVLHGGEPSLVGPEYVRKLMEPFPRVQFSMQSNGYLLMKKLDDWKKLVPRLRFSLSWDYKIRSLPGHDFEEFFEEAFWKLRPYMSRASLIVTVTKLVTEDFEEVMKRLRSFNLDAVTFERFQETGGGDLTLSVTHKELSDFFIRLDEEKPLGETDINPVSVLRRNLQSGIKAGVGMWSGTCSTSAFTVGPDLELYGCPNQAGDERFCSFGSLRKAEPRDLFLSPGRLDWISKSKAIPDDCLFCKFFQLCNTFCPVVKQIHDFYEDGECIGLKNFLQHMYSKYWLQS